MPKAFPLIFYYSVFIKNIAGDVHIVNQTKRIFMFGERFYSNEITATDFIFKFDKVREILRKSGALEEEIRKIGRLEIAWQISKQE